MTLQAILVIVLILPSVSFGQTETDDVPWDFDVSDPVRGTTVEVGFVRKLWNSLGLIFAPDVVKRDWPLYAYKPTKIADADPCQEGSRFADLTIGHDVALITMQISGDASSGYEGLKLQPRAGNADSVTDAALRFDDLCGMFQNQSHMGIQHTLAGHLALQSWMQPVDSGSMTHRYLICSEDNDPNRQDSGNWELLMEGTVTNAQEHDSERSTSCRTIEWNILDSRSPFRWASADSSDSSSTPPDGTWWRLRLMEGEESSDNLLVTFVHQTADHIATGSRFQIWYEPPPMSGRNEIAWYLLSDAPVPGIASDLRIDRQAFAGLDNLPVNR